MCVHKEARYPRQIIFRKLVTNRSVESKRSTSDRNKYAVFRHDSRYCVLRYKIKLRFHGSFGNNSNRRDASRPFVADRGTKFHWKNSFVITKSFRVRACTIDNAGARGGTRVAILASRSKKVYILVATVLNKTQPEKERSRRKNTDVRPFY